MSKLSLGSTPEGDVFAGGHNGTRATFTTWGFGQFNAIVAGPNVAWRRDMPAPVAVKALEASIRFRGRVDDDAQAKLLYLPPTENG